MLKHITILVAIFVPFPSSAATWEDIEAFAKQTGSRETISGNTGSYVFYAPAKNGTVTITRSLDNRVKLLCYGQGRPETSTMFACVNWDTNNVTITECVSPGVMCEVSNAKERIADLNAQANFWFKLANSLTPSEWFYYNWIYYR